MTKAILTAEQGSHEIVMSRVFNASPELIFRVITDPQYIPQWWGPRQYTTTVDQMEVKPGGQWRYVQSAGPGQEFGFHGVYHSISPDRIVDTFEFEGMPGHVLMETMTLEAIGNGQTRLTTSSVFQSVADRDGMLNSGMEGGSNDSYDRLEELLAKM